MVHSNDKKVKEALSESDVRFSKWKSGDRILLGLILGLGLVNLVLNFFSIIQF